MTYPILGMQEFGDHLLQTMDLDPLYVVLNGLDWDEELKARWCLAYWCTYHPGAACFIADYTTNSGASVFFRRLEFAAKNDTEAPPGGRWPRGKERRHWRGWMALKSWYDLQQRYGEDPAAFVQQWSPVGADPERAPLPFTEVADFVKKHVGFGPWMAFKIADMLEQVFNIPVNFDHAAVFMFKDPTEAAIRYWRRAQGLPDSATPRDHKAAIQGVVDHLQKMFGHYKAPNGKRNVGLQEIETILCKWKSHENGHYPMFNDWHELQESLGPWSKHSKLAERMLTISTLLSSEIAHLPSLKTT